MERARSAAPALSFMFDNQRRMPAEPAKRRLRIYVSAARLPALIDAPEERRGDNFRPPDGQRRVRGASNKRQVGLDRVQL